MHTAKHNDDVNHAQNVVISLSSHINATSHPNMNVTSFGEVIYCPYDYDKVRLIVKKMTD